MHPVTVISRRELSAFFDSLVAYLMLVAFLGFSGFFTWLFGSDIFLVGQASLRSFFQIAYWTLFFFIPAITMRMLAEEKKTGTLELLLTKAVTDRQVVWGKFLACFSLIAIALAFTLPYYLTVAGLGKLDHGATWCGYLGLLLMSGVYISIGLFASSLTSNQIVAFLLALLIGLFFHLLFDILADSTTGFLSTLFASLSMTGHFDSISRGVLASQDLIYFITLTLLGLFAAEWMLRRRLVVDS